MRRFAFAILALCTLAEFAVAAEPANIRVRNTDEYVEVETDALQARIAKKGYVSGVLKSSLLDKKTGARDLGFGLHIMDFLMAPGWKDDGYERAVKLHGNLAKHYVEGPQLCTQAKELDPEVIEGDGFVAIRMRWKYTKPGEGFKAGSQWEQILVFQPGLRYFLSGERITSVNAVDNLFYRLDMPGHIRHTKGDTFTQVYLSYRGTIPAEEFAEDFAPDAKFLYQRTEGKTPERMIRAYQVKRDGKPGPWLAGLTLDPTVVSEAWCHQRGYVCFIEELHGRAVKEGETIGAAYAIGWFDDVPAMEAVYDKYKGARTLTVRDGKFALEK
jgi:hypothetical protein